MTSLAVTYLSGAIGLLVVSTGIKDPHGVRLKHILIAALGWPLIAPVIVWKALTRR